MGQESDKLERQDVHVLVVDDDNRIRDQLKRYLKREGFRVSTACSAGQARQLMKALEFDLLTLDVMMPGEDGFELTRNLRRGLNVPIILLTAKGESQARIEGLKSGADDYLAKPFEPEELVLRMEAIFRRMDEQPSSPRVTFGPWEFDLGRLTLKRNGRRVKLTTGEETLLTLLAKRADTAVDRYTLCEKIRAGSERTVDVQITRLRRKIEDNPGEPDHIVTVRGHGYRLVADKGDSRA
ncbi:MAG: response regulator transcription factor [Hyphomonadaceae bacterium]|nr:response regulator transcription factor [Hyphomonadaceae bacterium]MBC6412525.1 response regulator transcription factor [Hyphomonadaceae bacterium]